MDDNYCVTMKTDESVRMIEFASFHTPRSAGWRTSSTRDYSELVNDLIQINPQIHLWDDDESLHRSDCGYR